MRFIRGMSWVLILAAMTSAVGCGSSTNGTNPEGGLSADQMKAKKDSPAQPPKK